MGRRLKNNIHYFSHDSDAWASPKFRALRAHYGEEKGWAMEARFWALNCLIANSEGCRLDLRKTFVRSDIAEQLQLSLKDFDELIVFLSDPKLCDLLNNDKGVVWTDRCDEELGIASKAREGARYRKNSSTQPSDSSTELRNGDLSDRKMRLFGVGSGELSSNPAELNDSSPETSDSSRIRSEAKRGDTTRGEAREENAIVRPENGTDKSRPAAAVVPFPSLLKTRLAAAGIQLANGDFDQVASTLIASGADCQEFVDHAIRKSRGKDNPRVYLLQGILKYDWQHKDAWRNGKAAERAKGAQMKECPDCHTFFQSGAKECPRCAELARPSSEQQEARKRFVLETALAKRRHPDPERPLTDEERAALAEYDAAAPDTFEDDFPEGT